MKKQKTIFITSFHGLISRILESGILDYLLEQKDIHVVLLVPHFKKEYFIKTFGNRDRVDIEGVSVVRLSKRSQFFHTLSFLLLHTKTMRLIRHSHRGYRYYYQFLLAQCISGGLGRWKIVRALFRSFNYYFSGSSIFNNHFERYQPVLVFSTDVKHPFDTQLLIEAKKRHIKTVGMVRSWDYLTAKGVIRVKPDTMLVHNEIIKKEAQRYADMKPNTIAVVGMPHFDPYHNCKRSQREIFFKRIGADPQKRLLFLAPFGDKFTDVDKHFFSMISGAIDDGTLPQDLQVLVRLPPGDTISTNAEVYRHLFFDYPGVQFNGHHRKENEMNLDDLLHLADSLHHSDVVLTGPSTIAIDAAAFDKPTILLTFDGKENLPYYKSVRHYYDFLHMQNIIKTKGVREARTREELFSHINDYLENPLSEKNNRARIVQEQCVELDGNASKRAALFIQSCLP